MPDLHLTLDDEADELLSSDPLALLLGMLLDQQMPMERAFLGPHKLATRMGVARLSAHDIASADPQQFQTLCSTPPAVHRFPASMAGRIRALAAHLVATYGGDTAALWTTADSGAEVRRRLEELPGFGQAKAAIFTALLAKQCNVCPTGWEEACTPYGEHGSFRSVADVVDRDSLLRVRQTKQAAKVAAKTTPATSSSGARRRAPAAKGG